MTQMIALHEARDDLVLLEVARDAALPLGKENSRSSDKKDRETVKRSNSLNEKRNGRGQRMSTSKVVGQPPKSSGTLARAHVSENEIMDLLCLDYEMPLTGSAAVKQRAANRERSRSKDKPKGHKRRNSLAENESTERNPREGSSSRERSLSANRDSRRSVQSNASNESQKGRRSGESRGIDRSNSSDAPKTPRNVRRSAPRKTKSDEIPQHALDCFLKRNAEPETKAKATSGARSVSSMPAKASARRRRVAGGKGSDRTDDTDSTKPCSLNDSFVDERERVSFKKRMGASGTFDYHHVEVSDEEDNASIDLDLATARTTFQKQNMNEKLQMHLSRTDNLLYSVFPKHVADALRNGQKVEPENHDLVTIFFSDIVGFTDISTKLDPLKISDMLDRLYHSFDALSDYHDVFKVETIGDAYMAVTNLAKKQPDHCKRISEFAIDAIRVANQTLIDEDNPDLGFVNIRVGFHSGPVVSNVVGTRNPRYCLFGDTVNTASRMESNSEKNRIHCSEASAALLKEQCPKIRIFPRGTIEVKGKGEMQTYWVHTEGTSSSSQSGNANGMMGNVQNVLKSLRGDRVKKVAA